MSPRDPAQYKHQISKLAQRAARSLSSLGVPTRLVDFDAPLTQRRRRPGDARSEFLANRAMGDWAEAVVQKELNRVLQSHRAVKYGNADSIVAGDPQFPTFYDAYQQELQTTGKRPDILLLSQESAERRWEDDISGRTRKELETIAPKAHAGVEVRSSKFYALKYAEARTAEVNRNPSYQGRTVQSFTPKLEDLRVVKRWIDTFYILPSSQNRISQVRCQAIFLSSCSFNCKVIIKAFDLL